MMDLSLVYFIHLIVGKGIIDLFRLHIKTSQCQEILVPTRQSLFHVSSDKGPLRQRPIVYTQSLKSCSDKTVASHIRSDMHC